jgi:hypothetical protein
MKELLAAVLAAFLVYLIYDTLIGKTGVAAPLLKKRKRLCDYYAAGSVYEDIPSALAKGIRLLEVHVYSDERDQPVVATRPQNSGNNFADDNISFEQVCIDIVNDAFPSRDPFILSIMMHTDRSVTTNLVAHHLKTIARRHLLADKDLADAPIDSLANKLVVVSGGTIHGTDLASLVNMNWSESRFRRITYQQGLHPRDPSELTEFNRDFITLVGPEPELKSVNVNPDTPLAFGCQWNLMRKEPAGFWEKPAGLQ